MILFFALKSILSKVNIAMILIMLFFFLTLGFLFFLNFIYFWLCWVFIAADRLSLVVASRGYSLLRCTGFSIVVASLVVEHGL